MEDFNTNRTVGEQLKKRDRRSLTYMEVFELEVARGRAGRVGFKSKICHKSSQPKKGDLLRESAIKKCVGKPSLMLDYQSSSVCLTPDGT